MIKVEEFKTLWRSTLKSEDTEEWLDVWFTRPVGLFFALIWRRLGVHPNAITILSIFLGIGAAMMFYHTDLWYNLAGVALLMLANFCDSTDGQLARMTGQKTLVGRVLDGFAGDVWFFCIYAALCLRMMPQIIPGTDMAWGWWIWVLGYVAGILCHTRQASLADYYRQIHLLFLKGKEGSELDSYESQHAIYESLPKKGALLKRLFYYNYQNYCMSQEKRTPEFQYFYARLKERYGSIENVPAAVRASFRKQSLPLMPLTNILSFNVRAVCIYVTCLLNCPWVYFVVEIAVLGPIYLYMHWKHEHISKTFSLPDSKDCAYILDFGGTLDTGGIHWARFIHNAYREQGIDITFEGFMPAYIYAERQLEREGVAATATLSQLLERKIELQMEKLPSLPHALELSLPRTLTLSILRSLAPSIEKSKAVVQELRRHSRVALVSNYYGNLETVLRDLDMRDLFEVVIDSTVVGVRKPDGGIFLLAMERLGVTPDNVTVVGDSLKNDILPAADLGCRTVWLKGEGWDDNENVPPPSTLVISDLCQLLSF